MEIREPIYKVCDKVKFTNHPGIFEVVEMINFNFCINDYFYKVKHMDFGELFITNEKSLTLYVEKPKSVWDLKNGDECYFLASDGDVLDWAWDDNPLKIRRRELGDLFLTKEEAEYELERRKIETEMLRLGGRRTLKKGENNWLIYYNDGLNVTVFNESALQGAIYFDLENEAYNAIKIIGEDRLKKYIFGVES